jgi:tetratricopeptide (TPR) repeat protein
MKTLFLFLTVFFISFSYGFSQSRDNGTSKKAENTNDVDKAPIKEAQHTPPPIIDREPRNKPPDPPGRTPNNNINLTTPPGRNPPSNPVTVQTPPNFIEYVPIPYYYNQEPTEPTYSDPIITTPQVLTSYDYKNLGLQQFKDENYYDALESFQTALAIDTLQYSLNYNIGITEIEVGRYDDAIYFLTMFIDNVIENRMGFYQRGLAYFYAGDKDSALNDFIVADKYKVDEATVILKRFYDY